MTKFGKAAGKVLKGIIYAESPDDCQRATDKVRQQHGDIAYDYVTSDVHMPKERFVKSFVPYPRYGKSTSNTVESMNGHILASGEAYSGPP
jgi:hypothetical protein